jgi:hypothetical protein
VGLLVLVIQQFNLENHAFSHTLMPLTFYGFLIHYFLPSPYRLPFFLVLSLGGISGVLGLTNAAWLVGVALGLIGICHLAVPFSIRLMLLFMTGAALVVMRAGLLQSPWPTAIWPVLGSMFMFRLLVYCYDLKHNKAPVDFWRTLSYFFLLPNVAFPLFPVIDYSTFCRTYYNDNQYRIYQKGVQWMLWGVIHLLLYRYIYYYWVLAPEEVTSMGSLVQYLVSNYALIIRISGQFHLIVGILHLFGFNLPRIMHLFFLASGFTDFWRRVNIYWKDFIQKVCYYPAYFRLRRWGNVSRLMLAALWGFVMTWFFHTYQWFWIQGSFLLSTPDVLFWSVLTVFVLGNILYEAKYGRKRTLGKRSWNWSEFIVRTLRTVGVFSIICVLWSLWASSSVSEWLSLWVAAKVTVPGVLMTLGVAVGVVGIAILVFEKLSPGEAEEKGVKVPFFGSVALTGIPILLVFMLGKPTIHSQFSIKVQELMRDLRVARLNSQDDELLTRGYYEHLTVNLFNQQLWEIYMKRPDRWPTMRETEAARRTGDFLQYELLPLSSIVFHGAPFSTNRWGMRDRDYEKQKPENTYRIALLGGSIEAGSGVGDNETYEWLLEDRLNQTSRGESTVRYEILNFAAPGYSPLQQLMAFEKKVLDFAPDAIIYPGNGRPVKSALLYLIKAVREGVAIPYDYLRQTVRKAGVERRMSEAEASRRLAPYGNEILSWMYTRMVETCRQRGIVPLYIDMPTFKSTDENVPGWVIHFVEPAKEAGFVVLDISDAFANREIKSLSSAEWDLHHPNAKGHELIADRLYQALRENGVILLSSKNQEKTVGKK